MFKNYLQIAVCPIEHSSDAPLSRQYTAVCSDGRTVYITGGRSSSIFQDVWSSSLDSEFEWENTKLVDPIKRYGHTVVKHKRNLIIFGGKYIKEEMITEREELSVIDLGSCLNRFWRSKASKVV